MEGYRPYPLPSRAGSSAAEVPSTPGGLASATPSSAEQAPRVTLAAGSWVLLFNPDRGLPIIGQIEHAWQDSLSGNWLLTITRYLRAEETWHTPSRQFWPNEIFKTNLSSTHSIQEVISPAMAMSPAQFAQGTPKQPIWYPHLPLYLVESKYTTNPAGLNVPTHSSRPFSKLSNWKNLVTSCLDLRPTPLQIQKQPSPLLNQTGRTLPNPIGGLLPTDSNYTPAAQTSKRALGDDTPSGNSDSSPDLKRSRTTPLTDLPSYPPYSTPFTSGSASHSLTAPTNSLLSMSTSASAETLTPSHPQLPPLQHPSDVSSRTPDSIKGVKRFNQWQGQAAEKPPFTYASLVAQAIYHSPGRAATLDQIYRFIVEQYPYYLQEDAKSWHNSIRHNLSLRQCFVKNERDGKNALWSLSIPQGSEESFDGLNLSTGKTNSRRTTSNSSSIPSYRRTSGGSISSTTTGASSLFDSVSDVSSMSAATPPVPWLHPYSAANLQKIEQQQPWPQAAAPAETEPKSSASIDTQATVTVAEASTEVDPAAEAAAAFEVTDAAKAFLGAHQGKPERPPFTFAALCAQAITQAPNGAPSLAEIYEYIQDSYPFFQKDAKGWQNSVRHNLSLKSCFIKVSRASAKGKSAQASAKGGCWTLSAVELNKFDGVQFAKDTAAAHRRSRSRATSVAASEIDARSEANTSVSSIQSQKDSRAGSPSALDLLSLACQQAD